MFDGFDLFDGLSTDQPEWYRVAEQAWRESDREAELLFDGKDTLTRNEFEIVFADDLTFDQKMEKLNVLRGKSPKSFKNRLNKQDADFAKEMGIKL